HGHERSPGDGPNKDHVQRHATAEGPRQTRAHLQRRCDDVRAGKDEKEVEGTLDLLVVQDRREIDRPHAIRGTAYCETVETWRMDEERWIKRQRSTHAWRGLGGLRRSV